MKLKEEKKERKVLVDLYSSNIELKSYFQVFLKETKTCYSYLIHIFLLILLFSFSFLVLSLFFSLSVSSLGGIRSNLGFPSDLRISNVEPKLVRLAERKKERERERGTFDLILMQSCSSTWIRRETRVLYGAVRFWYRRCDVTSLNNA